MEARDTIVEAVEAAKRFRRSQNLTQSEFAAKYCLKHQTVAQWESGRRLPDLAAANYLRLIVYDPQTVEEAVRWYAVLNDIEADDERA